VISKKYGDFASNKRARPLFLLVNISTKLTKLGKKGKEGKR
jgi:hypothetical protein